MEDTPGPPATVVALLADLDEQVAGLRRAQGRVLELVDELDHADAATACGYRSLLRLLQEHLRIDLADARALVAQAPLVVAQPGLSGGPIEPVLPATAASLAEGTIGREHLAVIAEAMRLVARVPHLAPDAVAETERQLAALAAQRTPRALARDAEEILTHLDPDGQIPREPERPDRALRLSTGRDGSLSGRCRAASGSPTPRPPRRCAPPSTPTPPMPTPTIPPGVRPLTSTAAGPTPCTTSPPTPWACAPTARPRTPTRRSAQRTPIRSACSSTPSTNRDRTPTSSRRRPDGILDDPEGAQPRRPGAATPSA